MIYLIAGASHTGKTALAQRLMEVSHIPYLSCDHLKMGLIRSGQTQLTPQDDEALIPYLWPIVREMIKTAVENGQSLIVEGIYIPPDYAKDFEKEYLAHIRCVCLVMSERYLEEHFSDVEKYASVIERRLCDKPVKEDLLRDNERILRLARENGVPVALIDQKYELSLTELFGME